MNDDEFRLYDSPCSDLIHFFFDQRVDNGRRGNLVEVDRITPRHRLFTLSSESLRLKHHGVS